MYVIHNFWHNYSCKIKKNTNANTDGLLIKKIGLLPFPEVSGNVNDVTRPQLLSGVLSEWLMDAQVPSFRTNRSFSLSLES